MKAVKYIFAFWAGTLIYVLLSLMFGSAGFSAYRQLQGEQIKQEANIETLTRINQELQSSVNSLLYDKDTLTVYAKEQGYAAGREKFIRIVGLGGTLKTRTSAGEVVAAAEPQYTPDRILKIIAFCTGLAVFVCMAGFDLMKFLRER